MNMNIFLWGVLPYVVMISFKHLTHSPSTVAEAEPVTKTPSITHSRRTSSAMGEPFGTVSTSRPRSAGAGTSRVNDFSVPGRRPISWVSNVKGPVCTIHPFHEHNRFRSKIGPWTSLAVSAPNRKLALVRGTFAQRPNLASSARSTFIGTRPVTSPPCFATSLIKLEAMNV